MKILDIPKSGRSGKFVFYMRGKNLCRRRYVRPRDPRTPAQLLSRTAFGNASKAWSQNGRLREDQRRAWRAAGAKIKSRPRLFQSGPLTGQQHFVGRGSILLRVGRELVLDVSQPLAGRTDAVEGFSVSYEGGRLRLKLRVAGPVVEDIMVFGAAPCSAGRKKWRTGAWLGLLPAPVGGECDITELYVAKYGEPVLGSKVFIRIRGQRNGRRSGDTDFSEVVPAKPATTEPSRTGVRQRRVPKGTIPARLRIGVASHSVPVPCAMHMGVPPEQYRSITVETPGQCRWGRGVPRGVGRAGLRGNTFPQAKARRNGHWRELWRGS